jgi:hypothetical protein
MRGKKEDGSEDTMGWGWVGKKKGTREECGWWGREESCCWGGMGRSVGEGDIIRKARVLVVRGENEETWGSVWEVGEKGESVGWEDLGDEGRREWKNLRVVYAE